MPKRFPQRLASYNEQAFTARFSHPSTIQNAKFRKYNTFTQKRQQTPQTLKCFNTEQTAANVDTFDNLPEHKRC